ncbi:acyl-CoA dehydrogenase family protein [Pseudovibrio sp. Ad26]|uniref:acyl-CoA dehydrogenase n=2 Tax=unclassified Pseudovibrio TaxID=2627060 RepID=UPI0007B238A1|nr:acyl-CoA dehydrogenase family protein [Pseudovibrio sp. Ad26]KZL15196.1 Acyl-CoA dehydrogenase fadE12 [Pseudovibrio sp. Ad26]
MTYSTCDDDSLIAQTVQRLLADAGGLELARAGATSQTCQSLWSVLGQELGYTALGLAEEIGGTGEDLAARIEIERLLGSVLAPLPYHTTISVCAAVLQAATPGPLRDEWAHKLTSGQATATLAHAPIGAQAEWTSTPFTARQTASCYTLTGKSGPLLNLAMADLVLIPARCGTELVVFAVPGKDLAQMSEPHSALDGSLSLSGLQLDQYAVPDAALIDRGEDFAGRYELVLCQARLALAAHMMGSARVAFDLTHQYICERSQFGQVIGSFQAIKHRMADLYVQLNRVDALIDGAVSDFAQAADQDVQRIACAQSDTAVVWASELFYKVSAEAIQLHGGVGMTWEYSPQLFFTRASSLAALIGSADQMYARLGQQLVEHAFPIIPHGDDNMGLRTKVGEYMRSHLKGEYAVLRGRGYAGDGDALIEERKAWERALAADGWAGLGLPSSAGGRGFSIKEQIVFYEEYARAGGPGRLGHIGEGLLAPTLLAFGTEDQQTRFLPGILAGTTLWAQGYSEPNAGSDLANIQTRARLDESGENWVVTGQKTWTSLAHISDWIFVLARAGDGSAGKEGLVFLLMPLDQPGIEVRPICQMGGTQEFNEVFFDGARARRADTIGAPGEGWTVATTLLGFERGLSTLGQQMGFARELELIVDQVHEGADDPFLLAQIGRSWAGLRAMRHGALKTLGALEAGRAGPEALGYKYEWSLWHQQLGELAMQVLGTNASVLSKQTEVLKLQQMFLFSRAETIYGGTSEIQLNIIAEKGLRLPHSPRSPRPAPKNTDGARNQNLSKV